MKIANYAHPLASHVIPLLQQTAKLVKQEIISQEQNVKLVTQVAFPVKIGPITVKDVNQVIIKTVMTVYSVISPAKNALQLTNVLPVKAMQQKEQDPPYVPAKKIYFQMIETFKFVQNVPLLADGVPLLLPQPVQNVQMNTTLQTQNVYVATQDVDSAMPRLAIALNA